MRLLSFLAPTEQAGDPVPVRTGVLHGDEVVDLTDPAVGLPGDMVALLTLGADAMARAAAASAGAARRFAFEQVEVLAPVPNPPTILAIGMNYRAHVAEMGRDAPAHQYWFNKQRTCVTATGQPVIIPRVSDQVDYEGELGIVIGRRAKSVPAERWLDVVAGFMVVNDVSARDWQAHSPTFTMGKSFDTFGPIGPWIVTPDEIDDPGALALRTWVNGELRQDASTADLIFTMPQMIEYLTTAFPLEPGDIISTGTPSGVGMGMKPPVWLVPGDVVRVEIEGIGAIENEFVAEPVAAPAPEPVVSPSGA